MKSSKLEIPQDVGSSVLSLIIRGNSRAGQSHCDFDFFFNFYFMAHDSKFFCKCVHRLSSRQACLYHAVASKLHCLACFLFCNIERFNSQYTMAIILSLNEHCNGFLPSCQYAAVQRMLPSLIFSDLLKCTLPACAFGI